MSIRMPTRRQILTGALSAGTLTTFNIITTGARAANYNFKIGSDGANNNPITIRLSEMCDQIRKESNGRLNIQSFPNSMLGNDTSMMSQLHSGAMQMMSCAGSTLSGILPRVGMDGVGFAFADSAQVYQTFDGPLGAYLRNMMNEAGIQAFPKAVDVGLRWITTSTRPIHDASDLKDLKLRIPPAQITVDLFRTLGAAPTALNIAELYTAMQSHLVDGQETPPSVINDDHFYEVQKYLCETNHQATLFWWLYNVNAFNALPADLKDILAHNADKYAELARQDYLTKNPAAVKELESHGMIRITPDLPNMRKNLAPYYARWRKQFGDQAWALLEQTCGQLS